MNQLSFAALGLFMGLLLITLLDTLGAISSRKAEYNYAYLSPLSFIIYLYIGYFLSKCLRVDVAVILTSIVGIYDATIGWKLALKLKANFLMPQEELDKITLRSRIITMVIISSFLCYIGHSIGAK